MGRSTPRGGMLAADAAKPVIGMETRAPLRSHPALASYFGHTEPVRLSLTRNYTVMQAWPARYGLTRPLLITQGRLGQRGLERRPG